MDEHEGTKKEAQYAGDSPFDGGGRPFSGNPNMSDFYYHDNPATNVGPYVGPSSYSINDVAPYAPPHAGEENPSQNVGPYDPPMGGPANPGSPEQDGNPASGLKAAYAAWTDAPWFDGTSGSIYARASEAERLRRAALAVGDRETADELGEQIGVLERVASEYDDSSLREAMDLMPGGQVALEYDDLADGGLVDLTSFLHVGAAEIFREARDYDWGSFPEEGAKQWVAERVRKNPGLLAHEGMTREAAVDYVKNKTMVLMDPAVRAGIIDEFVSHVERFRREAARLLTEGRQAQARPLALPDLGPAPDEGWLPGEYVELEPDFDSEGWPNLGPDDGTPLYEAALGTVEAAKRDWADFTTRGAREWFFAKAVDSPAMLRHADVTRRAAREYANAQAALVPDAALRSEIGRAFAESVEFLRQAHLQREAAQRVPEDEDGLEDYFGDEALWT